MGSRVDPRGVRPSTLAKPNNPCSPWSASSQGIQRGPDPVYLHCKETRHSFNNTDVVILDWEEDWVRRGIKEAIWERVEQPSLNRKEGFRFSLSNTWDRVLRSFPSRKDHMTFSISWWRPWFKAKTSTFHPNISSKRYNSSTFCELRPYPRISLTCNSNSGK